MFHPLSIYVGLRYVRARSHTFFVSFITWASLVGVCVGVAALIVILSVMNGFEGELRDRLLSLSAQVRVTAAATAPAGSQAGPGVADWQNAARIAQGAAGVVSVAPYAELQALTAARGSIPRSSTGSISGRRPASACSSAYGATLTAPAAPRCCRCCCAVSTHGLR